MANIKLKFYVDITNDRSSPVVFSSAYFTFMQPSAFRHDPQIPGDAASGRYHCKFLNAKGDSHTEISYLVRPGMTCTTYIAIDPGHVESEIEPMLTRKEFGYFYVYVTWWSDKEVPHTRLVKVNL